IMLLGAWRLHEQRPIINYRPVSKTRASSADRGKGAMVAMVLLDPAHVIRCHLAFDGSAAASRSPLQKSGKGDLLGKNVLFYRQG
ncbi:MAG: hypothetical protein EBX69_00385, partial [Betaproteobacteria bacterium]|nr:hypothetical protein [Betaproteobacteria bacterium]